MTSCPECGNPTHMSLSDTTKTQCPNCGAPLAGALTCKYCGTVVPPPQPPQPYYRPSNLGQSFATFLNDLGNEINRNFQ